MAYSPEHYQANKEKFAAKSKAWREKNKDRAKENRRKHYLENKEKSLEYSTWYSIKRKYSLSKEEYLNILTSQRGVCAICEQTCSRALAVDHCHTTGKVRGLLCNNCNRGIGHLKENVSFLERAVQYLKENNGCNI